ncbi:DUF1127 domain-containing protein [Chelativorans salis]|uniref:DUF1127 domain-containing protein n=1 Tax=Chelativorans salis TaxID=2978478 RepID=A0ABT2LVR2_9HYPH|nr:DUF1127 domain-containing protein [Chelativorans sp. EGI FJ00035]MCT7378621.1 DUF1127 domain-containing protein [Chelativorans sp. EGI FJ00035]
MRATIARAAIAAATTMLRARRARCNAWMLHELSDAQLKDIGLTRSDIPRVIHSANEYLAG